ncbi:MAG: hypothetical protein WA058_03795 [Minisyncoccia bacterium]
MENTEQITSNETAGTKRPVWQWILIYAVPALLVYGLVYYGTQSNKNGAPSSSAITAAGQTVVFTDSGFSPSVLTIKKDTTVTFQNQSTKEMRVASNPHPIHDDYPTRGGCISSTFDSCSIIPPGGSWTFTFDTLGTWGYHNHLNAVDMGSVVVQ